MFLYKVVSFFSFRYFVNKPTRVLVTLKTRTNNYAVSYCVTNLSDSGSTGTIAPVPLFQCGAPLQFQFHLFLVHLAYILQKLIFFLNYCWQTTPSHMQYTFKYFLGL